jgi:hypothetical protein
MTVISADISMVRLEDLRILRIEVSASLEVSPSVMVISILTVDSSALNPE